MENGHSPDHRIAEIHNDIRSASIGNIHRIQPHGIRNVLAVLCVRQEVDLVNMHRVQFLGRIDNFPVLQRSNFHSKHGSSVRLEFFPVYIETILILGECRNELGRIFLLRENVQ